MAYRPGPFTLTRAPGPNPVGTSLADLRRRAVSFDPVDDEYEHVEHNEDSEEETASEESLGDVDDPAGRELADAGHQLLEALEEAEVAARAVVTAMRRIDKEHRDSAIDAAFGSGLGSSILDTLSEVNLTFVKVYKSA